MKKSGFKKLNELARGPIDPDKARHPQAIQKADLHFHYLSPFRGAEPVGHRIYCVKANCTPIPHLQPVKK